MYVDLLMCTYAHGEVGRAERRRGDGEPEKEMGKAGQRELSIRPETVFTHLRLFKM